MAENQNKPKKSDAAEKKFEFAAAMSWGRKGSFIAEIWKCYKEIAKVSYEYRWGSGAFENLHKAYAALCGMRAVEAGTFDEFWNRKFHGALIRLFGREQTSALRDICAMLFASPFTHSIYRPSYRSCRTGDYAAKFFLAIVQEINYLCYDMSLADMMRRGGMDINGFENRLALALRRGDKEIANLVKEAVLGESGEMKLSNSIINGIIISGAPEQLALLGQLLLAAKGQEGIRQAILENADCGSVQSQAYFIKLVIDHNLVRFSAVIRAFGTWTGLAYDNAKPAVIDKCMKLGLKYLSDGTKFDEGIHSTDTLENYMALWASACQDICRAEAQAIKLVDAPEKYRRLVGWYFLYSTTYSRITHEVAMRHIDVRDPEELAWICCCLYHQGGAVHVRWQWEQRDKKHTYPDPNLPSDKAVRKDQFDKLCMALDFIGNKKSKFEGSIFPWMSVQLEAKDVAGCLIGLAGYDCDPDMIQRLAAYIPVMDVDIRRAFYLNLLNPGIANQRSLLLLGLSDKSSTVKNDIVKLLEKKSLHPSDITYFAEMLSTTSAGLRKAIMSLLHKQKESLIRPAIDALINSSNDKQLLAGIELLDIFGEKDSKLLSEYQVKIAELCGRANLPRDAAVILERFDTDVNTVEYTPENGFGLFDPAAPDFDKVLWETKRPSVKIYSKNELKKLLFPNEDELSKVVVALQEILIRNKGLECETELYDGSKTKVLLGDNLYNLPLIPGAAYSTFGMFRNIYDYYLADEIMAVFDALGVSPLLLATILCYGTSGLSYGSFFTVAAKMIFGGLPFENGLLNFDKYVKPYSGIIRNILQSILQVRKEGIFDFAMSAWVSLVSLIPKSQYMTAYQTGSTAMIYPPQKAVNCMFGIGIISVWRSFARRFIETDEQFAVFWNELWYEYLAANRQFLPVFDNFDILRAHQLGLISAHGLQEQMVCGPNAENYIYRFTIGSKFQKDLDEKYPFLAEQVGKAVERIVAIEEKRGELPTPLTSVASKIGCFKGGVKHFTALLTALGKDQFHRGYEWAGHDQSKKATLSVLMKNCYPLPDDTAESLKAALQVCGIGERRLLQAVMYAPQWADLVEKAAGIPGLASAVWLFHAHINERFSAEKETKVALYSPVSQQQFADGTFDKDWFLESYHAIGAKYFDELYKNAKYITSSNSAHRRSQLYTDAVLGRLDKAGTQAEIADKRNQEKLRAYALIPLDDKDSGDALARYEFIQKFAKESKQFGAQRRASEGRAVLIALQNLALTTGFGDADRMSWYLESEKMDGLRYLMEPHHIDHTDVWLEIAADGTPAIGVSKNGKTLKTLPKALAKEEAVLTIQTAVKDLREQKKRARQGFEMAMVSRTAFGTDEILRLLDHPVLKAQVGSLVFICGDKIGFPVSQEGQLWLISFNGEKDKLSGADQMLIAHPHDFIQGKCWSAYQQYLYKNEIVQPFKQVFREYYPVTEDELAAVNISRRYAGHQVQPQKTVALLKTRGWTVDYEEGLQRVYHKENLIARMYAMADWFSPADIEAPTIEVIRFYSRDTDELLAFEKIPPVIFSEVMRDIDLVVSVAHVGGVDPEASHSTVEMRIAIARELLSLLSVDNVSFKTAHALIKGSMGDYSVHMGSGVVHLSGTGMLAVLPVHSQARGRVFLPFADDDPKTAEIMSKILLFANDKKIKDPAILRQISQ